MDLKKFLKYAPKEAILYIILNTKPENLHTLCSLNKRISLICKQLEIL